MSISYLKNCLIIVFCFFTCASFAQEVAPIKYAASKKGKFFISWGGNRESYSKSDIRFKGANYDFTIENATAHDRPKGWHIDYINPGRMTIPQTNFKLGYFISDHYAIILNQDHMKYVMDDYQHRTINGNINLPENEAGSIYNGNYNNETVFVTEDFLQFEHTDGLNYVHVELARYDDISSLFNLPNIDKFQINLTEGIGAGVLFPKTNAQLLLKERHDDFHISGFGTSLNVGLNFTFYKHFYIQLDLKGGYINMNDIRTTPSSSDKASQDFFFLQRIIALGGIFRL